VLVVHKIQLVFF